MSVADLEQSRSFAVRISRTYDEVKSEVETYWISCFDKVIVYQHDADEDVSRTHIHALCMGYKHNSLYSLKNHLVKTIGDVSQSDWSFKSTFGKNKSLVDEKFISYMSKGSLQPCFNYNFDLQLILELTAEGFNNKDTGEKWKQTKLRFTNAPSVSKKTMYEMFLEIRKLYGKNAEDMERYGLKPTMKIYDDPTGHYYLPDEFESAVALDIIITYLQGQRIMFTKGNVEQFHNMLLSYVNKKQFVDECFTYIHRFDKHN